MEDRVKMAEEFRAQIAKKQIKYVEKKITVRTLERGKNPTVLHRTYTVQAAYTVAEPIQRTNDGHTIFHRYERIHRLLNVIILWRKVLADSCLRSTRVYLDYSKLI